MDFEDSFFDEFGSEEEEKNSSDSGKGHDAVLYQARICEQKVRYNGRAAVSGSFIN